jgi:hypothetical protein
VDVIAGLVRTRRLAPVLLVRSGSGSQPARLTHSASGYALDGVSPLARADGPSRFSIEEGR